MALRRIHRKLEKMNYSGPSHSERLVASNHEARPGTIAEHEYFHPQFFFFLVHQRKVQHHRQFHHQVEEKRLHAVLAARH